MKNPTVFNTNKREVSCRTINTIIAYVRQQGKDATQLLAGLPFDEEYLTDTNNWVSREVADEVSRRARVFFDDDDVTKQNRLTK